MPWDITAQIEDRPGTLADIGEALGTAGVNIEGVCGFPCEGVGVIHILVDEPDPAISALESAGVTIRGKREVLVVPIDDQPGVMGRLTRSFADHEINIDLLYLATGTRMVLGVDKIEAARLM
jgi:hypothetical protein